MALAALAVVMSGFAAPSMLPQPVQGGLPPVPVVLGVSNGPNGTLLITGAGQGGRNFQAAFRTNLAEGAWTPVGPVYNTNFFTLTVSNLPSGCFYRIQGPNPNYIGAESCADCHGDGERYPYHVTWSTSAHARAFANLPPFAQTNATCLPCHTVGFGYPNGYTTAGGTEHLRGVQCENCHGPAGNHAVASGNLSRRPVVEKTSRLCGGCHTDAHQPTYEEWLGSGHSRVDPELVAPFTTNNVTRMANCGPCHGGAVRLAMMANPTAPAYPKGSEGGLAIECVVCHEPHDNTPFAHQLRNPTFSTEPYSWYTSITNFSLQYNPNVQVCGQCHNMRGAEWRGTTRPPHHSPQYNILIGNLGTNMVIFGYGGQTNSSTFNNNSAHTMIENQCVACHMTTTTVPNPTEANPNNTGHDFHVRSATYTQTNGCVTCHTSGDILALEHQTQTGITNLITTVVTMLDNWGVNKGPTLGFTNAVPYGAKAWEYSVPGGLSPGAISPQGGDAGKVPDLIRQARWALYLVAYDGSLGMHNAKFSRYLLLEASNRVWQASQ